MTEKQTSILGFLTLFAVLAAIWLILGENKPTQSMRDERLFPDLSQKLQEVESITISDPGNSVQLIRRDGLWLIEEKQDHPADQALIGRLLRSLADARIKLAKTSDPALYDRIGLDPEQATRLSLMDQAGETMASLGIGNREANNRQFDSFVRPLDGPRSYLVKGLPEIRPEASTWLDPVIFQLDQTQIAGIEIVHRDGERILIKRDDPGDPLGLTDLAPDEQPKPTMPGNLVAAAFRELRAEDVRPASDFTEQSAKASIGLVTFEGDSMDMTLYEAADETGDMWAILTMDAALDQQAISLDRARWAYRLPAAASFSLIKSRDDLITKDGGKKDDGA
ncbi:hypothetical protein JCM17846_14930 [Iodidimonas nitroreducens]|uniref:DUF4340 domain-containing protein n=1 Tax=Iodidimonas nitroreducens TaxID=1236968 RepID=A0A5A7N686_9PROT|nr:DUF4340 domain-containing protein [Iodidimonas nitroreducens]GAK34095.1 hypothetical protein AQ1_01991 [alpha proteobacterium Q-1]GER03811.1 hypothetical protein JCM17846_14930 [Iodidimonas nitroreducens]